jgi:hypothetical protein
MKTALTLIMAIVVPGGLIVLAIGLAAYLLARRRKAGSIAPAHG